MVSQANFGEEPSMHSGEWRRMPEACLLAVVPAILHGALSRVRIFNVDDHRTTPSKEQYYLLTLGLGRIDIAMHRMCWDVEEISRIDVDGIPSAGAVLEAGRSRDDVAIDVVVAVVMPAGDHAWIDARANDHKPFPPKRQVPADAWACRGFRKCVLLRCASLGHIRLLPMLSPTRRRTYCKEGRKGGCYFRELRQCEVRRIHLLEPVWKVGIGPDSECSE
jgi:hypothetical protein